MKILLSTTVHGDERHAHQVGSEVQKLIKKEGNSNIDLLVAHDKAYKLNKRFLETDLNRSFGVEIPLSFEEKLAVKIRNKLERDDYDLVLDMHNTKASGTTCAIVVNKPSRFQFAVLDAFSLKRIVQMPPSGSLLSALPKYEKGISIEIAEDDVVNYPASKLAEIIAKISRELNIEDQITKPSETAKPSYYQYAATIQNTTLRRLGLKKSQFANFKKLTATQIQKLGVDVSSDDKTPSLYTIFLGGGHMGKTAMNLVRGFNIS